MIFGVTPEGFILKRLADCKDEYEEGFKSIFGEAIDLAPNRPYGQLIGIFSERESLIWEALQATYQSGYARWATGINLDSLMALTGTKREDGSYSSVILKLYGTTATVIPQGQVVSVLGNTNAKFKTDADITIGAGTNAIQTISFAVQPVSGNFTLLYNGESTATFAWNVNSTALKLALDDLDAIDEVTVVGTTLLDFVIEFVNADGTKPHPLLVVGANTLSSDGIAIGDVTPLVTMTTVGSLPFGTGTATAILKGAIVGLSGTVTVIETQVSGWDSVINPLDSIVGNEIENDADAKFRREQRLTDSGSASVEGIRSAILALEDVSAASVYQNTTDVYSGGLPPHSVSVIIQGGNDALIAKTLFETVGGGIATIGNVTMIHVDSEGHNQTIKFSRPVAVTIYLEADITVTNKFPANGADLLKAAILEFGLKTSPGEDVIVYPKLIGVFDDPRFPGIEDIEIRIGKFDPPTLDTNIMIQPNEKAIWDSSRIEINVTSI